MRNPTSISPNRQAYEEDFKALYQQHWELLFRLAYKKTGSLEDSYDLVHDLFADIWRNVGSVSALKGSVRSYLISSLYHKIFNYFRSKGLQEKHYRNLELFLSQQKTETIGFPLEVEAEKRESINQAITREITRMPVKMQNIFVRSIYQEQSIEQIAGDLSISRQTVKNQLHLASRRLRMAVKKISRHLLHSIFLC